MYAEPCKDEKLPGWGSQCTPTKKTDGTYDIKYISFKAKKIERI